YRARHVRTGRIVTLEVWPGAAPAWVPALATVRHPGLVEVVDFGEVEGGGAFAVVEPAAGEPLEDILGSERLPPTDAPETASSAARALAALAAAGRGVRALDAGNVVVDRRRRPFVVKLVDLDLGDPRSGDELLADLTYRLLTGKLPIQGQTLP